MINRRTDAAKEYTGDKIRDIRGLQITDAQKLKTMQKQDCFHNVYNLWKA